MFYIVTLFLIGFISYLVLLKKKFTLFSNSNNDVKLLSTTLSTSPFKKTNDKVLVLIAHPDDECMFFGPTLLTLKKLNIPTFLLCLSNGNQLGLGSVRAKELVQSGQVLGIPKENIQLIDSPSLKDGETWAKEDILYHTNLWIKHWGISKVLTFDDYGVSGHSNHISLSKASHQLSLPVWQLCSLSLLQKYFPFRVNLNNDWEVHVSIKERNQVREAMKQHKSQMVWFRWLYIHTSRFMTSNWLKRIDQSH